MDKGFKGPLARGELEKSQYSSLTIYYFLERHRKKHHLKSDRKFWTDLAHKAWFKQKVIGCPWSSLPYYDGFELLDRTCLILGRFLPVNISNKSPTCKKRASTIYNIIKLNLLAQAVDDDLEPNPTHNLLQSCWPTKIVSVVDCHDHAHPTTSAIIFVWFRNYVQIRSQCIEFFCFVFFFVLYQF